MALDAAVRFQRAARQIEQQHTRQMDVSLLRRELDVGIAAAPPGPAAIVMERLEDDWAWVAATPLNSSRWAMPHPWPGYSF